MKKVLLGTTALVAAGLLVTSVAYADEEEMMAEEEMMEEEMAAESVSLSISGTALVNFGASTHASSPVMGQTLDPLISGTATMDNGLTFGVSANPIDGSKNTITVDGAFGSIQLGDAESARAQKKIAAQNATTNFGVNGPYQAGVAGADFYDAAVGTGGSGGGIAGRDTKVVFVSPSVGGIELAASYAPGGTASDQISAALTFTQELGDASVSLNVGYETASIGAVAAAPAVPAEPGDAGKAAVEAAPAMSPTDLNVGASISVGDIALSGGMRDSSGGADGDSMQMDVGALLKMGALKLSAAWANQDSGTDMYALGASYPLGEGVQLDTQLDFGDNGTDEWVQFMAGVAVSF
jgi:hypothetical protein